MFYPVLGAVSLNVTVYLLMSYPLQASLLVAWLPFTLCVGCVYEMIKAD